MFLLPTPGWPPFDSAYGFVDRRFRYHSTMPKLILLLSRRLSLCCLALAVFAVASVARAQDVPKFTDPDVTAFVKTYGEFADQYAAIMKDYMAAMKSGDTTKMQASSQKVQGLQGKTMELQTESSKLTTKLKPEETQKFTAYLQACAQKMADAAK